MPDKGDLTVPLLRSGYFRLLACLICLCIGFGAGFGAGVYALPILTAEKGLSRTQLAELANQQTSAMRTGTFVRDLADSDAFHWGDGTVTVTNERIWLDGQLSPGPDYRLYLVSRFVETEAEFLAIKDSALQIAPIKAFSNFSVDIPQGLDISGYNTVLIWCEAFSQFITAAEIK